MRFRAATVKDWAAIERLLADAALPADGAREHLRHFIVCEDGAVRGCIGAEVYGNAALMRSFAVEAAQRGKGLGLQLAQRMIEKLERNDITTIALLTTTAESFFLPLGFEKVERDRVPAALHASEEFKGSCPASATAMLRRR
jgi:amino-acid N-acetyltransferase